MLSKPCREIKASSRDDGGISWFFSSYCVTCMVSLELPRGTHGSSRVDPRSPVSIRVARVCAALLLSHGREIGPQDALKAESRGLSRVEAGNPMFPRPVTVTSGSFSGCLWEVRNTVDLGGASRDSTRFGAMEEGLILS